MKTNVDSAWDIAARAYLDRLGAAEWAAQGRPIPKRRTSRRFSPSEYHRALINALNRNDEHAFKALKMLEGYSSALGV